MKTWDIIKAAAAKHDDEIAEASQFPRFRSVASAHDYISYKLSHIWRQVLDVDDDVPLPKFLGMSPTMALIVQFVGLAILRHGADRSKAPAVTTFIPIDVGDGQLLYSRAVSKNNISRVIGKSRKAVDEAINKLRGKGGGSDLFFEKKLAYPSYIETGILMDLMTTRQQSFAFMAADYAHARAHAIDSRLRDAVTNQRQVAHCDAAIDSKMSSTPVESDAAPAASTVIDRSVSEKSAR